MIINRKVLGLVPVLAILATLCAACVRSGGVTVEISAHPSNLYELNEVYVIAAAEKSSWPAIKAGEHVTTEIVFKAPAELSLLYRAAGKEIDWRGPIVDAAEVKEVHVTVTLSSNPQVSFQLVKR